MFDSLEDARRELALWRYDYNNVRPHSSLANQTPAEARRTLEQFEGSAPDALAQTNDEDYQTLVINEGASGGRSEHLLPKPPMSFVIIISRLF